MNKEKEHPTCVTCNHWGKDYEVNPEGRRDCNAITFTVDAKKLAVVEASMYDDSGFVMRVFTKPDFYCKLHKPKETP